MIIYNLPFSLRNKSIITAPVSFFRIKVCSNNSDTVIPRCEVKTSDGVGVIKIFCSVTYWRHTVDLYAKIFASCDCYLPEHSFLGLPYIVFRIAERFAGKLSTKSKRTKLPRASMETIFIYFHFILVRNSAHSLIWNLSAPSNFTQILSAVVYSIFLTMFFLVAMNLTLRGIWKFEVIFTGLATIIQRWFFFAMMQGRGGGGEGKGLCWVFDVFILNNIIKMKLKPRIILQFISNDVKHCRSFFHNTCVIKPINTLNTVVSLERRERRILIRSLYIVPAD